MFCQKCGTRFNAGQRFCTKCGTQQSGAAPRQQGSQSSSVSQHMGAMIISDSIKGHAVIKQAWVAYLIMAVALIVFGLIFGSVMRGDILRLGDSVLPLGPFLRFMSFLLSFFCLINATIFHHSAKGEIIVFERGIRGLGIIPKDPSKPFASPLPIFKFPIYASIHFELTYGQITSVAKLENCGVILNVAGVFYQILVNDPDKIIREINIRMGK